ncbi:hypothetical protein ABZ759_28600 [Streptomyces sp. NPDC047860]|uniref:hypothetical protein n=1 Tax=Streptomyces sp. NPDC047860 TaxID=3155743 RepID=UPI00340C86A2
MTSPTIPHLVNLTPHHIRVLGDNDTLLCALPPTHTPARCHETTQPAGELRLGSEKKALPLVRLRLGDVTGLPEPSAGTWHIVSRLVADALPQRTDLLVPHDVVRDSEGQITGCRALAIGAAQHPMEP